MKEITSELDRIQAVKQASNEHEQKNLAGEQESRRTERDKIRQKGMPPPLRILAQTPTDCKTKLTPILDN